MSPTNGALSGRWSVAAWCLWTAIMATPGLAQQPALSQVRMEIDVVAEAPDRLIATVDLDYELRVDPALTELSLQALRFSGALPQDVTATVDGEAAPVSVRPVGASRLQGRVLLPGGVGSLRLRLSYRVVESLHDQDYRVTLPLLLPAAAPTGAPDDFFVATLTLPDGHVVLEAFPTLPPSRPGRTGAVRSFRLQVVPAMLRWRGRVGEPPFLRFGRIVDLTALLVLALSGAMAVRVLGRESQS